MKSGSEGAGRWPTNKIVWVQKQGQGIQYVHPSEKVLGRRQSWITGARSGEEMKGLVGRERQAEQDEWEVRREAGNNRNCRERFNTSIWLLDGLENETKQLLLQKHKPPFIMPLPTPGPDMSYVQWGAVWGWSCAENEAAGSWCEECAPSVAITKPAWPSQDERRILPLPGALCSQH